MNSDGLPTLISLVPEEERDSYLRLPLFIQLARRLQSPVSEEKITEHLPMAIQDYGLQDTEVYIEPRPISKLDFTNETSE